MKKCWIRLANGRISDYICIDENDTYCLLKSTFTQQSFTIEKKKVYFDKNELFYATFVKNMLDKKMPQRLKSLESTKQKEYRTRFINDYPDKLI